MTLNNIRSKFPILDTKINNTNLIYLDNAATTHKPYCVINSIVDFYTKKNSNINRGIHYLSRHASYMIDDSREYIRKFINAECIDEIIFTSGTTQSINMIAHTFGSLLEKGDEIILTELEHNSNIIPWYILSKKIGVIIKFIKLKDDYSLDLDDFDNYITEKTKLISICHVSNALGVINPIKDIINLAHRKNILVLIDAAQSVPHINLDVKDLDCDFLAFSGHKMYGPTGIGIIYGKKSILNNLPIFNGGGGMIKDVSTSGFLATNLPNKFEAGTPNISGIIGLKSAIKFINSIGINNINSYESKLMQYLISNLLKIDDIQIYMPQYYCSSVSFNLKLERVSASDVGYILDRYGVAVRTGKHCANLIMDRYNINSSIRVSIAIYNTFEEIDSFIYFLKKSITLLKKQ